MASGLETGATFSVRNGPTTVYSAPIGADLGSWSNTYPHVYALDFDAVSAVGSAYTIVVTGPIAATSPTFRIDTGASLYAGAIANSLNYYQVQRDGPNFIPSALRTAPAHLHDATAMTYLTPNANSSGRFSGDLSPLGVTIDASGGWFDAGDYLKFLHGAAYTAQVLMIGVRDFPNQMGAGAGAANFTAEARHGADWILRMWDDTTRTLYYQVGIGSGNAKTLGDHDIWRLPQADDTFGGTDPKYRYVRNRPVFRLAPPGGLISPNMAGREAGALALCYQLFRVSDPAFANQCLVSAQHVYDLANTNPTGNLVTVIPFSFYPETEWRDDLELAAVELHRAMVAPADRLRPGCLTPIRRSTCNRRPTGPTPTSPGRRMPSTRSTCTTWRASHTTNSTGPSPPPATRRGWRRRPRRWWPTCASSSTAPRPRPRPTRSDSVSRGPHGTPPPTVRAWR